MKRMITKIDHLHRHPEEPAEGRRLEGWKQALCLWPSFETVARKRARPPQDDGGGSFP
jgi:hypothetical protein